MKRKILITRPRHDRETTYLHYFSKDLLQEIEEIGEFVVINLEGDEVTRENFETRLRKNNIRFVILNGHGSKKSVCGHNYEVILDEQNIHLLSSTVVYAVACDSAADLGELAVMKDKGNADAYVGYEARFMMVYDTSKTTTLTKDKNIRPFQEVYAAMVTALLSGLTVGEAVQKTKRHTRGLIREYGVQGIRDTFGDAPLIRFALIWDLLYLKVHGNLAAVL